VRVPLDRPPATDRAEAVTRRAVAWDPPALPGLAPGTVRRWRGQATWQPPETAVLARHRSREREHWIVTNRREPPEGYELEFDIGLIQQHEQPGTRLLVERDGAYALVDAGTPPEDGARALGHVEQAAFPMMDALELRRVTATGQLVPVAGSADPLRAASEFVAVLGFIEGYPIQPRALVERPLPPWNLTRLVRTSDAERWRHAYDTVDWDADVDAAGGLALGSVWTQPGPGLVALWRDPGGRITSDAHTPWQATPGHVAVTGSKWVAAPLAWSGRPRLSALRAAASRARHLAADAAGRNAAGPEPKALGYLRAENTIGCTPLFSALHPAIGDQFLTRSTLEAKDMGYWIEGVLGYIADIGAARVRGPRTILWGSRFGVHRRYVED
jgi:hypothetical protein